MGQTKTSTLTYMHSLFIPTDPAAQAHSQRLKDHIVQRIRAQGPLNFAQYMELALYAPGLGYYVAGAHKLGRGGDFTTAPEISPIFSQCLAQQCAQVIREISGADILELGAGSGRMALEILRELNQLEALPQHYFIVELSPDLQERQQELLKRELPELVARVHWVESLPTFKGIILANEVLGAMPVHRFKQMNELMEYYVGIEKDELQWQLKVADPALKKALEALELSEGYTSEINMQLRPFIKSLEHSLTQGLMLFIDYGFPRHEYYHPQRSMGTLMCHYQQQAHQDSLILVGIQDITAHVDFTAVAEAGADVALELAGFCNQASFLMNCGLTELMNTEDVNQLLGVKQLILPTEMGELFKVMGLSKALDLPYMGFKQHDQRHRL